MSNKHEGLGKVDLFGLDDYGQPAGMNPMWGAAIGTGVGTTAAIATRQFTKFGMRSELVGLGAGVAASAAMMLSPNTRAAGWTSLAATFLNNGLRELELRFFMPGPAEATAQAVANGQVSGVVIDPTQALQGVEIERTQALMGNDMPQLVGANVLSASAHLQGAGGPGLAAHAGHWGATIFG